MHPCMYLCTDVNNKPDTLLYAHMRETQEQQKKSNQVYHFAY